MLRLAAQTTIGRLAVLGKHKVGTSCLCIDKLADVDLDVLATIVTDAVARVRRDFESFDR